MEFLVDQSEGVGWKALASFSMVAESSAAAAELRRRKNEKKIFMLAVAGRILQAIVSCGNRRLDSMYINCMSAVRG